MPEIYGNNTISQLEPRRIYRPILGWSTERRFRGAMTALNSEASAILAGSPNVEIQIDPPHDDVSEGVMTVRVPDAQDGSSADSGERVTWGCPNGQRDRALIDHPKFVALDEDSKRRLSAYYSDASLHPLSTTGDAQSFSDAILKGQKVYATSMFTLRRVSVAPADFTIPDIRQYVDVVFTRAQIISLWNPPANIVTQMPSGGAAGEYLCIRAELEQNDKGGWQTVMEWAHNGSETWSFVYTRWS